MRSWKCAQEKVPKTVAIKGSSTANLFCHLQQNHKVQYKEWVKLCAATNQSIKPRQPVLKKKCCKLHSAVCLVKEKVVLPHRYGQLPTRDYFTREAIPKIYKHGLTAWLAEVSHCALTTDMWSSVTVHFTGRLADDILTVNLNKMLFCVLHVFLQLQLHEFTIFTVSKYRLRPS